MALDGGLRHLERGHPGVRLPGVLPVARAAPAPGSTSAAAAVGPDRRVPAADDRSAQRAPAHPAAGAGPRRPLSPEAGGRPRRRSAGGLAARRLDDHRHPHRFPAGRPARVHPRAVLHRHHRSGQGPELRPGDLLLRAPGPGPAAAAVRAVPGRTGLDRDLLHRPLRGRPAQDLPRARAGGDDPHRVSAQSRQLAAGGPEPPRDRHRTRQRSHPVHADDACSLLPRLRRRRVHPRRGRVDRAGPRPLPGRARPARPAGDGAAGYGQRRQPVPAESGARGAETARRAQPVQAAQWPQHRRHRASGHGCGPAVPDARPAAGRGWPATTVPAHAVSLHGADRAGQEPGEHRPAGRAGVPRGAREARRRGLQPAQGGP